MCVQSRLHDEFIVHSEACVFDFASVVANPLTLDAAQRNIRWEKRHNIVEMKQKKKIKHLCFNSEQQVTHLNDTHPTRFGRSYNTPNRIATR